MYWNDFLHALRKLDKRLWVNLDEPVNHSDEYPGLILFGIEFDRKHICSVTHGQDVPWLDVYDQNGTLTHQGIFRILEKLITHEWVPGLEYRPYKSRHYRESNESWFSTGIDPRKIERIFRKSIWDIRRKKWDKAYSVRERSSSISLA